MYFYRQILNVCPKKNNHHAWRKNSKILVLDLEQKTNALCIDKLREDTGFVTLDFGYKNTGATTSKITFLDGEEGILRYRGYVPI